MAWLDHCVVPLVAPYGYWALLGLTLLPCPVWIAGVASLLVMTVRGDTMAEIFIHGLLELLCPLILSYQ